jgi:hypothetical protein
VVSIKSDPLFRKKPEIVSRQIAGETILVPVVGRAADMQRIFSLNEVGEFIWSRLDGNRNIGQIAEEIVKVFNIGNEQANSEAEEFIKELIGAELIEEVS